MSSKNLSSLLVIGWLLGPPAQAVDADPGARPAAEAARIEATAAELCLRRSGAAREACFAHMERAAEATRAGAPAGVEDEHE